MQLSHTPRATSAVFDDPNLVSSAGLVPVMALARSAGLHQLGQQRLTVPTDKGANAGLKVASLVAGMVAGADTIDDMALLRHGGMGRVFTACVRAVDAGVVPAGVHLRPCPPARRGRLPVPARARRARHLTARSRRLRCWPGWCSSMSTTPSSRSTATPKQGAGFGYSEVRGLNALLATVSTTETAPVIVAQRLRKGSCGSPRGATRLIADAVKTVRRLSGRDDQPVLVRDATPRSTARHRRCRPAGRCRRVGHRPAGPNGQGRDRGIADDAWTTIEYTDAVFDEPTRTWISRAEVAEIPFTAFTSARRPTRSPDGWSCAGSRTSTPSADRRPADACSTSGGSTPSSPPPSPDLARHRDRGQDSTAVTRSSNRSTPT